MISDYDNGSASSPVLGSLEFGRLLAVNCDATQSGDYDLAQLWEVLRSGQARIVDVFTNERRCYAVIRTLPEHAAERPLEGRTLDIMQRLLLGQSPKGIAIDLRVSPSTVSDSMRCGLRAIGLGCRVSSVPLILAFSARAALRDSRSPVAARISYLEGTQGPRAVVSIARLDRFLEAMLSDAEANVIGMLAQGFTHAQIARARGTSRRTVANQLSAAFRKLGVSGRRELLNDLIHFVPEGELTVPRRTSPSERPALSA